MNFNDVPEGGVVKHTEGTFTQIFNKDGVLCGSEFAAHGPTEFADKSNEPLPAGDERAKFDAPFLRIDLTDNEIGLLITACFSAACVSKSCSITKQCDDYHALANKLREAMDKTS